MSSLATQLQSIASLDASRLTSRGGYPSSKSYLFSAKEAASHDLDAIFSLAQSGFEEIISIDPTFATFEDELFSEKAKRTDRMMFNEEENRKLDVTLEKCLRQLGRWIGLMAGGKCIEWLVRRFRVHEMNAEAVLQVFLPYHSSPNFARMLAILTIPKESVYHVPFAPLVAKSQTIPRSYITNVISPEREKSLRLLQDVVGSISIALREGVVYRALLGFWSGVIVELLEKSKKTNGVGEGLVKVLVEAFVEILSSPNAGKDVNAAVYSPLILLTRSTHLADGPFEAILEALLTPNTGADVSQRVLTLLVVLNDRKAWKGGLGLEASTRLAGMTELGGMLVASMEKYDFVNALSVILDTMVAHADAHRNTIAQIIDSPSLPSTLAKSIAANLLTVGSSTASSDALKSACRSLVSMLRERHPLIVDTAALELSDIDPALIERPEEETTMLNLLSADVTARVDGINALLAPHLATGAKDLATEDSEMLKTSLLPRLADNDVQVLDALYKTAKHRDVIANVCSADEVVDAVRMAFTSDRLNGDVVVRHLGFVCNNLVKVRPDAKDKVFEELLFPILLATKGRSLSGAAVDVVKTSTLGGTSPMVNAASQADQSSPPQVAKAIADALDEDNHHTLAFLVAQLSSRVTSARLLAHLVLINIFVSSTIDRISLAVEVMAQIHPQLTGTPMLDFEVADDPLSTPFLSAVTTKSRSPRTWQYATIALFVAMAKIPRVDRSVSWLVAEDQDPLRDFARGLYEWSNSNVLPRPLSAALLRSLFIQLGPDVLVFLASVWTDPQMSAGMRTAALRHADAFVSAHQGAKIDFQLVVPALLVVLQDPHKTVRQAAVGMLKVLRNVSRDAADVYALDTIYGQRSETVQLLKSADLESYLGPLVDASADIVLDAEQLRLSHVSRLSYRPNESKKDAAHRRAVIDALLSHVLSWQAIAPRLALLRLLVGIDDRSVLRGVFPLLLASTSSEQFWVEALSSKAQNAYLGLLWETFRPASAGVLQEDDASGWTYVVEILTPKTAIGGKLRSASLARMEKGVFDVLPSQYKVDYITALLQSLDAVSTDEAFSSKATLASFKLDSAAMISIIEALSQPLEVATHKKKQKQDDTALPDQAEKAVSQLTALVESRDWTVFPGNARLLASLLALLNRLLSKKSSLKEGIDYLEQELLSASLAILERITDAGEIQRAHVGIEVIIKVIRASGNPRTSQRALLVASELARLIPESVLHNAMPIFTFVSASELQRDDAYSFGVVEKTVERIVPVMTKSLRAKAKDRLDLYRESKTFLGIFTDMASRLPKHRTLPFFVHLVKSLGAEYYLAPVVMLLVDRSTSKAARGNASVAQVMELPLGVAAAFDADIKLDIVLEVVAELARLVDDLSRDGQEAFLTSDGEPERLPRQLTALLSFATTVARSLVGQPCDQYLAEATVKNLLLLASKVSSSLVADSSVPGDVQACLAIAMQLLSAQKFLGVIIALLELHTDSDIAVALNILVERLPRIKPEVRVQNTSQIGEIVKKVSGLVKPSSHLTGLALAALRAIASSAQASEDSALAGILGGLVKTAPKLGNADQVAALSLLDVAARHLASRVIPFIRSMVELTLSLSASASTSASVSAQAFALQCGLVEVVPTFVSSKQLFAVLRNALNGKDGSREVMAIASRKIPTKTIFPVVMDLWKGVQNDSATVLSGFFDLLRMVLKQADRVALAGLLKSIFAFFLDVFDLRHRLQIKGADKADVNRVEGSAIGSFLELVTKLNEATFKPLFIRLYDWAVVDLSEGKRIDDGRLTERRVVLLHVMVGLLTKFKNLLSPYIGTLMPHIEELLPAYQDGQITDEPLLLLVLDVLAKSFDVDDGAFWTDALLSSLIPLLVNLLDTPLSASTDVSVHLARCLGSLAGCTASENVLKLLNTSICLASRSDRVSARLASLEALEQVWIKGERDEMMSMVGETVSEFLGELVEDENGDVEVKARRVIKTIEGIAGDVTEFLE